MTIKKNILTLFSIMCTATIGISQGNIHYYGWDSAFNHNPSDIIQTPDGGFFLIGDVNSSTPLIENFYFKRYIVRTDSLGDTLWTRYYKQEFYGHPNVMNEPFGGFTAFGSTPSANDCNGSFSNYPFTDYAIQKYSFTGDSLSTNAYNDICNDDIIDINKNFSGEIFALIESSDNYIPYNPSQSIKNVNSYGVISSISISNNNFYFFQIERANNGYWLPISDNGYNLIKISNSGNIMWQNPVNLVYGLKDFCKGNNDSLVFICSNYDSTVVIKTDSFGNTGWVKNFKFYAMDIMQHSSGNFIITGSQGIYLKILVIDINGDSVWSKTYVPAIGLKTIENTNTIAILGQAGGQYVLVLDTMTSVVGINEIQSSMPKFQISLSPNPCSTTLNIHYSLSDDSHVALKLYDITGNLIYTLVNEKQTKGPQILNYNGQNLKQGIYFCKFVTDNNLVVKRIVKVN